MLRTQERPVNKRSITLVLLAAIVLVGGAVAFTSYSQKSFRQDLLDAKRTEQRSLSDSLGISRVVEKKLVDSLESRWEEFIWADQGMEWRGTNPDAILAEKVALQRSLQAAKDYSASLRSRIEVARTSADSLIALMK